MYEFDPNKTIKENRLTFLEDMVNYYSEDPSRRGVTEEGLCSYRTSDDKTCAIGRYIPDDQYSTDMEEASVRAFYVYPKLPIGVLCLGFDFLGEVQSLHDVDWHWHSRGLTERGLIVVHKIKMKFC